MSQVHKSRGYNGHEGIGILRFIAVEPLAERLQAFRHQSARASLGSRAVVLYSEGALPFQTGLMGDEQTNNPTGLQNHQDLYAANQGSLRRKHVKLYLEDQREYKRLKHDDGLNIRLQVILDDMTRQALGNVLGYFADYDRLPVNYQVPRHLLESGPKLIEARDRFDEGLAVKGSGAFAVKPNGVEFK